MVTGFQDLISYEIERLSPLKIKECAIGSGWSSYRLSSPSLLTVRWDPPTGGLCGSVFLDIAFQKYIETIIGEMQYNGIKQTNHKKMMREFEYGIKRCFSEHNDQTYSVDLKGVKNDPENGIVDDTITVKMYSRYPCLPDESVCA